MADFVGRCKEHGVLEGAAELSARAPSQGDYYKRTDLRLLEAAVHADPAAWAADISAVAATLSSFDLRTVYLQTLNTDQQQAGLAENDGRLLTNACTAAWDLKNQLEAGDGSADPDIDERARYIVAQLLRQAWALGADPGVDEAAAVAWLMAAVRAWTAPASVPDNPYDTASATSGGLALVALLQWSVRRAADHGELPAEAATQLTELVADGRDDRALAAIGAAPAKHGQHPPERVQLARGCGRRVRRPAEPPPSTPAPVLQGPTTTVALHIDCAPYDGMWVVWIRGVLGTDVHVDAAPASPAGDEGERPIRPWQLVVVSAARAAQSHGDPARALWESGDEELRARRTVVVRIDESVPGIRADRCLVDLAHGNATRGRATLERALRVLGALPSPVHTSPDPTSARFPPDGPALCRIPPADPTFVGRDDVLAALHRQLVTADSSTGLRSVCLWGLGGVGKTSTALAYAHQFQRYYETVWWLRAETEADLRGDLVDLGSQLGVPTDPDMSVMLREVQQRIAGTENTLLIFDNAEPESWLRDLWPRGRGVHLLVTTRQPDWTGLLSADQRTEILPPELTDAARLLLKASEAERPPPQEQEAARAVAADLGCLPLALAHAAAYVRQSGITLQHFHALLTTSRQRLLNEYQPDHSSTPVTLTWSLSLRRSDEQTPGTADLMALCAMLAPDEIPRQLLHVHADALGGTLGTVLADLVAFDAVVRSLVKYSLVKAAPDALRLHRLVQDAVLSGLTAADAVQWLTRAAAMVLAAFPEDVEDLEQWPACDRLTGHAQAIVVRYGQVPHELCAGKPYALSRRRSPRSLFAAASTSWNAATSARPTACFATRWTSSGTSPASRVLFI